MCPPNHFEVRDVKNFFMEGHVGTTNKALAMEQWQKLHRLMKALGFHIDLIDPVPGLEDMTFSANSGIVWQEPGQNRYFLSSNMVHRNRQRELPYYKKWFSENEYCARHLSKKEF